MDPRDVLNARRRLGLNQARFAELFAVPVQTIQSWERGNNSPDPPADALLTLAAHAKLEDHTQ